MALYIRIADLSDVDRLSELAGRTFPLACPPELDAESVALFVAENLSPTAFCGHIRNPGAVVLLGEDATGSACAYALLLDGVSMDPRSAGLVAGRPTVGVSKFYVDPGLHGSGAAGELLIATVESARAAGAASLWLATNVGNSRARAFYAKNGFVERGTRVFRVGGTDNDDVVLERPL